MKAGVRTSRTVRSLVLGAVTVLVLSGVVGPSPVAAASGPWLKPGIPFSYEHPDPSVVALGPQLFSYGTNHGGADLPVLWSADATTWATRPQYEGGAAYQDGDRYGWFNDAFPSVPWGINYNSCDGATPGCDPKELWAPSVAFIGGHWVAFHAVKVAREPAYSPYGRFAIYVSVSDSPIGPFRAASSRPIINTSTSSDPAGAIDPDVFVDETTGRAFLLWKTEGNLSGNYPAIWSRELNFAGTGFRSGSVARKLITVSQRWEGKIVENPSLTRVNSRYVLLYSGNNYTTTASGTGYAICRGPVGPCTKSSTNPIMRSVTGGWGPTGADGIVDQRGRFIAVYHAWTAASGTSARGRRTQHVARLNLSSTGQVTVAQRDLAGGSGGDALWRQQPGGGHTFAEVSIGGTYIPAAGDFDGEAGDDIIWYGSWDRGDAMWLGRSGGGFGGRSIDLRGTLIPLAGDFDGNGKADVYWYQPGPDPKSADQSSAGGEWEPNARNDELWLSTGPSWVKRRLSMPWASNPIVGDFDGSGTTDILWASPGGAADRLWLFDDDGSISPRTITVAGAYRAVAGDFDGNGIDDILWYAPGALVDSIWWFNRDATYSTEYLVANGDQYRPFAGQLDGSGGEDLFWYAPGTAGDFLWTGIARAGRHDSRALPVNGVFDPVVGDYDANGIDDILWYS